MFEPEVLREAVEIQIRGYRLIRWLGVAIDRGIIQFTSAHQYTSDAQAAAAWVGEHYQNLPPDARPPALTDAGLARFGNYFASFLNTSFELVAKPGMKPRSTCGCRCWCCSYLAQASHLVVRKVTTVDKKRASRMQARYVGQLALDHGLSVSEARIDEIVNGAGTDEASALAAYSVELLARCAGQASIPATLVLWRRCAWNKTGSPKKDFVLRAEDTLEAEALLVRVLRVPSEGKV